jgi:hypothetical protein
MNTGQDPMMLSDFQTADAAAQAIEDLDRVDTTRLWYFVLDEDGNPCPREFGNYRGLLNAQTGRPITPITSMYAIVNHADAFGAVLRGLEQSGYSDKAGVFVQDDGDFARLWMLFPSDDPDLSVGCRLTSSYDRSITFTNHLIGWWHPGNAAIVLGGPKDLGLHLALPHRAEAFEGLEGRIATIVQTVNDPATRNYLRAIIDRASRDRIAFTSTEEKEDLLTDLLKSRKHIRHVIGAVQDECSRWDVYTAVMRYVTETPPSVLIRDKITNRAEEWLRA